MTSDIPGPPVEFLPKPGWSNKIMCSVCGRDGHDLSGAFKGWKDVCLRGHRPCPGCGRMMPVKLNGEARIHARCPERSEEARVQAGH